MAKSSACADSGFRFARCSILHCFMTSLVLLTALNFQETQGTTIVESTTLALSLSVTTEKPSSAGHAAPRGKYASFMKGMTGALGDDDLEYSLDYYNEKALVKEFNFDPMNIVEKLADSAMSHETPPNQFMEEMQDLLSLQNRSRSEPDENTGRDELKPGYLSDNLLKRMTEGWKNELKRLETKYNVSSECAGPDSITAARLALMFPHYLNFGQKPFAVSSDVSLSLPARSSSNSYYTTTENYWGGSRRRITTSGYGYSSSGSANDYKVPAIFKRAEFGGLIPVSNDADQRVLVGLHLYALYGKDEEDVVPFRTKCVLLRRRMQKCVLSNARRRRFLVNNGIYQDMYGSPIKASLTNAFENLPSDFTAKIDWKMFEEANVAAQSKPVIVPSPDRF